ncbi:MAG: glycosyltransferase family protein [Rhodospirillaceae bacterium]
MSSDVVYTPFDRERPVVLCLNSLQFNRDVQELQARSTRYAWPALLDTFLSNRQRPWMPRRLQEQALFVNESGPDVDAAWAKAKRFGLGVINALQDQGIKVSAVMAGNWDYWNEECMRLACGELGLPFLVLRREHHLIGIARQVVEDFYSQLKRLPDNVSAIAVAGEATRKLIDEMKLWPPSKVRITGWPRLDVWRTPVAPAYDRPVVLMSYLKGYGAPEHFMEMLGIFSGLAARHPEVPFLVKAKHYIEVDTLREMAAQRGLGHLQIIDSLSLPSLLINARAVIGFHSAAMYEALLSPAPILIPRWGQTDQDPMALAPSPGDKRLAGHMSFLPSEQAFEQAVTDCIANDRRATNMDERIKVFGEYFAYSPDRTAVERVEDFVDEFIKK